MPQNRRLCPSRAGTWAPKGAKDQVTLFPGGCSSAFCLVWGNHSFLISSAPWGGGEGGQREGVARRCHPI